MKYVIQIKQDFGAEYTGYWTGYFLNGSDGYVFVKDVKDAMPLSKEHAKWVVASLSQFDDVRYNIIDIKIIPLSEIKEK